MNATERDIQTTQQNRLAVWRLGGFSDSTIRAEKKRQAKAEVARQSVKDSERRLRALGT